MPKAQVEAQKEATNNIQSGFEECLPSGRPARLGQVWSSGISGAVSHDGALLRSVENVLRGAFVASGCRAWSGDKAEFGSRGLSLQLVTNHSDVHPSRGATLGGSRNPSGIFCRVCEVRLNLHRFQVCIDSWALSQEYNSWGA